MKHIKKMMALVIAMVMALAMAVPALAVSISVAQDSTFNGEEGADSRVFTYYEIFRATKNGTSTSTGGGYDEDGTPGEVTQSSDNTATGFSYYLTTVDDAARIAQLGTWVAATDTVAAHWEKASGNLWFKLTPSFDGSQYVVEWDNAAEDTDTVQAAAKWLGNTANYTPITSGNLTWDSASKKWAATGLDEGYYLLKSDTGDNLVAATTDIEINEKNAYPPQDKTQADEDDTTQSNTERDVAVGDILTYNVKVSIPKTAKVGDKIVAWDKSSLGLTYNNDVAATANGATVEPAGTDNYTGTGAVASADWCKLITVTADSIGKDVIFTFTMTVNSDALVDTDKMNESGIKYGNGSGENPFPYESKPDKVEYKTYYAGIEKIDGTDSSKKLEGVKFTLKENGTEFKVTKVAEEDYYIPDANGSSEVVTDANGLIHIRGLDEDKTYTLTETYTLPGYNLLDEDITLVEHLDTTKTVTYTVATVFDSSATYFTKEGTSNIYTETSVDGATFTANPGKYYTKSETGTESYDGATDGEWEVEVENNMGSVLPSTGGIGTTIFYVIGAILVLGAGILLVTKRRMSAN